MSSSLTRDCRLRLVVLRVQRHRESLEWCPSIIGMVESVIILTCNIAGKATSTHTFEAKRENCRRLFPAVNIFIRETQA